jgi:hypothetical protein
MRPINFKGTTHYLGAPKDWNRDTQGECISLPVEITPTDDGQYAAFCTSVWQPDEKERKLIAAGMPVALRVWGGQPAVALYIADVEELPMPTAEGGNA